MDASSIRDASSNLWYVCIKYCTMSILYNVFVHIICLYCVYIIYCIMSVSYMYIVICRYSWEDVKRMYDLLDRHDTTHPKASHPLTYNARLGLLKNSAPQLRWLAEITGGSVYTFSLEEDAVDVRDVLYLQQRFPVTK